MSSRDIEKDAEEAYLESSEDYVGLWQIIHRVKRRKNPTTSIMDDALGVVRALLARGLKVGNLNRDGGFEPWDDQYPDAVVSRIRSEWAALGKDPSIDDICWFHQPRV
jgi:hypothetical protein